MHKHAADFRRKVPGRFIQADTIVPGAGNPGAWDRYAYGLNNPIRYIDPTGHFCYDSVNNEFSAGDCYDEMQQQLLDYFIEQLESGDYTDLELMENLMKRALDFNSDPVIALRAATEIVRNGTPDDRGMGWGFERGASRFYYEKHTKEHFDDSGFGDLADTVSANQISHFVGIAYIAAYQKRAKFSIGNALVWGNELGQQTAKQKNIDRDLGYMAVDTGEALVVNHAEFSNLSPQERRALANDSVDSAVSHIQAYDYADAHPIRNWWDSIWE